MIKPLLVIGLLLSLTGCIISPKQVHYYQFEDVAVTAQLSGQGEQKLLLLAPVSLRGDLNNRGIISQLSPHEISSANWNLWGESPSVMLSSTAQQQLQNIFADRMVMKSIMGVPRANIAQVYELQIELDQFNAGLNHDAVIQGSWRLIKRGDKLQDSLVKIGYFSVKTPLKGNGFDVLVGALQQGWRQSIVQIGEGIAPLIKAQD